MKKIINGKLYDTETAIAVGSWSYGYRNNFRWAEETLYRKRTGEFFLHGEGGPLSKYREPGECGGWDEGEAILCAPEFDAKKWAEQRLDADTYISLFGPVCE